MHTGYGSAGNEAMKFDRLLIVRLVVSSVIFAISLIFGKLPGFVSAILLIFSIAAAGYDIAMDALSDITEKDFFSTSVMVTAITVLSFVIGFRAEAAALVLLYQIGLLLVSYAEEKSRLSALGLLEYQDDNVADTVTNIVLRDSACHMSIEDSIRESASFVLKIAMAIGIAYAIIVPIFTNLPFRVSIHRALTIILIATPSSVIMSMPTCGIMGMCFSAKYGVIFGSASAMETCAYSSTAVFDSVGVFTEGSPEISAVIPAVIDKNTFLSFASHALYYSEQPLAQAVSAIYPGEYRLELIDNFIDYPGRGVEADIGGAHVYLGTGDFIADNGISLDESDGTDARYFYMVISGHYVGKIIMTSSSNGEAENIVIGLKENGVSRCVLLCEDDEAEGRRIADRMDFREVYCDCDREKKLDIIENLKKASNGSTVFVYSAGFDGHSAADVDIRVSDHARFADVLVSDECISNIPFAFGICSRVKQIALENAIFSFVVKAVLIFLSIIGYCNLWFAIFVDLVAAVGTILNAVRVTKPSLITQFKNREN